MNIGRVGMKRPEDFPKLFYIYSQEASKSAIGRPTKGTTTKKAEAYCILSVADPDEVERFSQDAIKVTHKIFHKGPPLAKQDDVLKLVKNGVPTRTFRVAAQHDKGEMSIFTTYYCEERGDVKSC